MKNYPMESTDETWQAEGDARTLADGEEIKADVERLKKAKAAASRMAIEKQEQADAMKNVGLLYDHPTSKAMMDGMKK